VTEPLIFGAWAIGGWFWGDCDLDASRAALRAWVDAGLSWVDTAPIYGFGVSEEVVGELRDHLKIATKCGLVWQDAAPRRGREPRVRKDLSPASVKAECEASLRRLGVERIDLYQCHWPDPDTPVEDTMGALLELKEQGKIDAIGVSNFDVELLERACAVAPIFSNQPRYSALDRGIEADVLPWCREHGLATLAYSPLEQGLLTGAVSADRVFPKGDTRRRLPRFSVENRRRVAAALDRIGGLRPQATLAQLVLAWTAAQPGVCAIVGARSAAQAAENAGATRLLLEPEELGVIDRILRSVELVI